MAATSSPLGAPSHPRSLNELLERNSTRLRVCTVTQVRVLTLLGTLGDDKPEGPTGARDASVLVARAGSVLHSQSPRRAPVHDLRLHRGLRSLQLHL